MNVPEAVDALQAAKLTLLHKQEQMVAAQEAWEKARAEKTDAERAYFEAQERLIMVAEGVWPSPTVGAMPELQ